MKKEKRMHRREMMQRHLQLQTTVRKHCALCSTGSRMASQRPTAMLRRARSAGQSVYCVDLLQTSHFENDLLRTKRHLLWTSCLFGFHLAEDPRKEMA